MQPIRKRAVVSCSTRISGACATSDTASAIFELTFLSVSLSEVEVVLHLRTLPPNTLIIYFRPKTAVVRHYNNCSDAVLKQESEKVL